MGIHLFTGFPGFIATQLIKGLIGEKKLKKFYAVVLESQFERATEKANTIMEEMDVRIPFEIIVGDITLPNLGIKEPEFEKIRTETLTMWHLAAIYDLAVKEEIAWQVNVVGTKRVCEFARNHPSIERLLYFSTAYVAGKREGTLLETELIRPKAFKNHYEETKFEAELLVEELKEKVPVTIIRPGIVRGHSKTGETVKFDGPYFFMNMIDRLKWMPIIPYVGKSDAHINVVPIDYIIAASIYLASFKEAAGYTVHLTDPSPYPVKEVYRAMVLELTGKKPKGRLPQALVRTGLASKRLQRKLGVEAETLDYLTWNAIFDTTNAERLLRESGICCADFIESIPSMATFYKENKLNKNFHIKIG
ncbi:SDR family oxidoreductase [Sporosarcina sp. G11-34]|uniref:SDR family oxidoreductase n=1 Tax=Sporosarcina sp. G11-34 TaxID=2849605 RepID=UPI0022A8FCD2|nr:SDR family oxidoreductase [Sporosarcina sp. G11-34]MCZ2258953.1 SDR family oxidoreductase [Sporosarcina sp. G11-34]